MNCSAASRPCLKVVQLSLLNQVRFRNPKIIGANFARSAKMIDKMLKAQDKVEQNSTIGSAGNKTADRVMKGVPSVLQMDRGSGSVLRSRQITLNSIFMQDISEILATNDPESELKNVIMTSVSRLNCCFFWILFNRTLFKPFRLKSVEICA
jgi:hypothetical protein